MAIRTDSLFFRVLEPVEGWHQPDAMPASQRARMLDAVTRAVAEKGYAAVTVGDVVSRAGVSRRTFYEQFSDKQECFLAAYETGTKALICAIRGDARELDTEASWRRILEVAIERYLGGLAEHPEFARTFLIDVLGAGPEAVERRRRVFERFVDQYRLLADRIAADEPQLGRIPDVYLQALVGGISELVQQHILEHGAATLPELAPVLVQLVTAVFEGAGVRQQA